MGTFLTVQGTVERANECIPRERCWSEAHNIFVIKGVKLQITE